jgi:hypothetical protein
MEITKGVDLISAFLIAVDYPAIFYIFGHDFQSQTFRSKTALVRNSF